MDKTSNMDNTTKKVIFLDIDGTLAIPEETVPVPSALDVIRKKKKKGHYVFLCTGRSYCLMSHFMEFGFDGAPAYKLILMSPSMKNLDLCRPALEEEFQFCIQDITEHYVNCELINRKFNKGTAVRQICEHLCIPIENSIGFGDSMNDKEMLETVGLGICMANGNEQMKQLADDVCPTVTEDGIQKAFLKYHLV